MKPPLIDPHELPFSEDEFFRAFALISPGHEAHDSARFVVQVFGEAKQSRERARAARERGSQDPTEVQEAAWVIGDEAFALLAELSDELRSRVDAFMRERWEAERPGLLAVAAARSRRATSELPPEDLARVESQLASHADEWERTRESVRVRIREFRELGC